MRITTKLKRLAQYYKPVGCILFALFWVYGLITVMAIASLNLMPTEWAAPFAGYTRFYISVISFDPRFVAMLIVLNNLFVFSLCIWWTFAPNVPVTGFLIGCLLKVKGASTASLMFTLLYLYSQPFAILELGAYVLAISFSLFKRLHMTTSSDDPHDDEWHDWTLVVFAVGTIMLVVAGFLEAA